MFFVYEDEDNSPMNEDVFDRVMEATNTARELRGTMVKERFMDNLQIPRGSACRDCIYIIDGVIKQYRADDDLEMPGFCYDIAKGVCNVCKNTIGDKHDAIRKYLEGVDEGC